MTEIYQIPDEDKKALETLFANLQFITLSKELIYRNDDYYNISISGIGVCLARVGTIPLFMGEILQLWEQTQWLKTGNIAILSWAPRDRTTIFVIFGVKKTVLPQNP